MQTFLDLERWVDARKENGEERTEKGFANCCDSMQFMPVHFLSYLLS